MKKMKEVTPMDKLYEYIQKEVEIKKKERASAPVDSDAETPESILRRMEEYDLEVQSKQNMHQFLLLEV